MPIDAVGQKGAPTKGNCWLTPNGPPGATVTSSRLGKIRIQFAAIVIHSPACAYHDFAVEPLRTPGDAKPRRKTPLAAGQGRGAHARRRVGLFPATITPLEVIVSVVGL